MPDPIGQLAERIAALEAALPELSRSSRLAYSAIDDGSVAVTAGGSLRAVIGQQPDGTTALNVVNGPPPPRPSLPVVEPALAALAVTWDGRWAGGAVTPLDWSRVEIHVGATSGFVPDRSTLATTIETPQGGSALVPLAYSEHWVVLRARSTAGVAGPATAAVMGAPRRAAHGDIEAGAITAESLAADAINGRTITGSIVQTGVSGPRVILDPDTAAGAYEDPMPGILVYTTGNSDDGPASVVGENGSLTLNGASLADSSGPSSILAVNADDIGMTSNFVSLNVGRDGEVAMWVPVGPGNTLDGTYYSFTSRGCSVGPWFDVDFAAGWVNYGQGYQDVQYRQMPDGTVKLRGVCKPTSGSTTGGVMFTLPGYVWPTKHAPFGVATLNRVAGYMLVSSAGTVAFSGASGAPGWVSVGTACWSLD